MPFMAPDMFSKSGIQGLQLPGEKEQQQTNPKCCVLGDLLGNCDGFAGNVPPKEERAPILQLQRLMLAIKEYLVRIPSQVAKSWSPKRITKGYYT